MTISERVKSLCKERGIPVYQLERALGFSNGYFAGLIRGNVPYDRAVMVAEYFDVPVEYVLTGENPKYTAESGNTYYLDEKTAEVAQEIFDDPDLHALFDAAKDSSPENLRLAAEMLKRLKETNRG